MLLCVSLDGEAGPYLKPTWLFLPSLTSLPSSINKCLNPPAPWSSGKVTEAEWRLFPIVKETGAQRPCATGPCSLSWDETCPRKWTLLWQNYNFSLETFPLSELTHWNRWKQSQSSPHVQNTAKSHYVVVKSSALGTCSVVCISQQPHGL